MHHLTKFVGIVNLTPDSFSDGGSFTDTGAALAHIEKLIEDGASVIDIGAESTRPGATPLLPSEEWLRLEPVLAELERSSSVSVQFSVDTRHVATAKKSLDYGVHWINDVSGLENPDMLRLVASSNAGIIVMHSLSVPADKNKTIPHDADVMETLFIWMEDRLKRLLSSGMDASRIIFDPGIGFGKTREQSMQIIRDIRAFHVFGVKLMVGHSRKSFLNLPKDATTEQLDAATIAISKYLVSQDVQYLRVHNVAAHGNII